MKIHYKQEMKYLKKVAAYLNSLGYRVEEPSTSHRDLLDVWGMYKGRKCFMEIYVTIYTMPDWNGAVNGVWHQGEHDGVEVFLNDLGELKTFNDLTVILDDLKPFKTKKRDKK